MCCTMLYVFMVERGKENNIIILFGSGKLEWGLLLNLRLVDL